MVTAGTVQRSNDQWLADLATEGAVQEQAISDLRHLLIDGLHRGLLRRVRRKRGELASMAEDFAQDALLKIIDKLDSFRGESQFTTWAHKIAVRVALTELRRKRWRDVSLDALVGDEDDPKEIQLPDPGRGPEAKAARKQLVLALHRYITEELSAKQRHALMAVSIHGVPLEVVAQETGSTRNALYKLLHDARKRLKLKMEEGGYTAQQIMEVLS